MIHVLTDANVVSVQRAGIGWTVGSLLTAVATAELRFNALIDTGALITGLSNLEVAKYLLSHGLGRWCEGVVFLNAENDEKMILVKGTGRVLKLSQCGIAVEKRFAFYDQIHTTGMDIKHSLNARAALTLGKDMVFRDLAQGAFRMRGIGEGQTVTLLVIPEVEELMQRQLVKAGRSAGSVAAPAGPTAPSEGRLRELGLNALAAAVASDAALDGPANGVSAADGASAASYGEGVVSGSAPTQQLLLCDVSAWLVINSMRAERVQFDQLCQQNLANIWRQNAFGHLMQGHRQFQVRPEAATSYVREMLGDAFVSCREGSVSSARLEGKVVGVYFCDPGNGWSATSGELQRGLREIYDSCNCCGT